MISEICHRWAVVNISDSDLTGLKTKPFWLNQKLIADSAKWSPKTVVSLSDFDTPTYTRVLSAY